MGGGGPITCSGRGAGGGQGRAASAEREPPVHLARAGRLPSGPRKPRRILNQ